MRSQRFRSQDGQATLEWTGLVVMVAAVMVLLAGVLAPSLIVRPIAQAIQDVLAGRAPAGLGPGGALTLTATSPPGGVASFRDSHGNLWTWVPSGPQGPHWQVTGPGGAVSIVSPQGTLLSGPSLGAIAFPIVKITRQGNTQLVETADGKVYVLQDHPASGPDEQDLQDVANEIISSRSDYSNVSFVMPSRAEPRPDIVAYNSLKPGSTLHFVEVKNLNVDNDGQINAWTGAGKILDAMQRQGAGEVVIVLDTAPDPNSELDLVQQTNRLLASKGVRGTVTIAVRESGDIGEGPLHEAWTGELGSGVSSDSVSDLSSGEANAQDDQPGDDQAGEPDPGNPVLGGGDGEGDGSGDGLGVDPAP